MGTESLWMFDFVGTVLPIFGVVIVAIIFFSSIRGIREWGNNNKQPVLSVSSRIVSKRIDVVQKHDRQDQISSQTRTTYYITFEVESGDRMEFCVKGPEYGLCADGDSGQLTFQGTRYLGFKRYVSAAQTEISQEDYLEKSYP